MYGTKTKFLNLPKFFSKQRANSRNGQIAVNLTINAGFVIAASKLNLLIYTKQATFLHKIFLISLKACKGEILAQNLQKVGFGDVKCDKYSSLEFSICKGGGGGGGEGQSQSSARRNGYCLATTQNNLSCSYKTS